MESSEELGDERIFPLGLGPRKDRTVFVGSSSTTLVTYTFSKRILFGE